MNIQIKTVMILLCLVPCTQAQAMIINKYPLHTAAQSGDLTHLRILLTDKETSIDQKNNLGQTPLMKAVEYGQGHIVDELIDKGASLTQVDRHSKTALHYAASKPRAQLKKCEYIVNKLLKCDIRQLDYQSLIGCTPLHTAILADQQSVAWILLSYGADKDIKDNAGNKPYHYARAKKFEDLLKYLSLDTELTPVQPHVSLIRLQQQTENSNSPTEYRLKTARAMLHAQRLAAREAEQDAQEYSSSSEE